MLGFKNKIEMRKRRQNNNRPIKLPQDKNILHNTTCTPPHPKLYIKGIYYFKNCCVAMYVS